MEPRTVVNIQDPVGKTVVRRGLPKGVFRFKSHEEADAQVEKYLGRFERPAVVLLPAKVAASESERSDCL